LLYIFGRQKGSGIEVLDFSRYFGALTRCIEAFDFLDSTDTIDSRRPKLVSAYANRRNNSHSRDNYTHTQFNIKEIIEKASE
jgi:hypothetical protein